MTSFVFFLRKLFFSSSIWKIFEVGAVHLLAFNEKTGRLADRLLSTRLNAEDNTLSTVTLGHFLHRGKQFFI